MAEPGAGLISFEELKGMMDALNQLFSLLLSQEQLVIRGLRVEAVGRQRTLNGKEVVLTRVTVALESDERVQDYLASAGSLIAGIEEAGFKVICHEQRIEIDVALPPFPQAIKKQTS